MSILSQEHNFKAVCALVKGQVPDLAFSIFEIGAVPLSESKEPFYAILDEFEKSTITAFEVDEDLCATLNRESPDNVTYYPQALGRAQGLQPFYITNAPMCCSLYRPNDEFLKRFNGLEVAELKSETTLETTTLDAFVKAKGIGAIDFIKIDIQGAELDVFKGGAHALKDTSMIVSEVEFVPLYENQPLFGDVCAYLSEQGMIFHKFLGLAGRIMKPLQINSHPFAKTQDLWSDAVYVTDFARLNARSPESLLKLGILSLIYQSPDITINCFKLFDEKAGGGSQLLPKLVEILTSSQ